MSGEQKCCLPQMSSSLFFMPQWNYEIGKLALFLQRYFSSSYFFLKFTISHCKSVMIFNYIVKNSWKEFILRSAVTALFSNAINSFTPLLYILYKHSRGNNNNRKRKCRLWKLCICVAHFSTCTRFKNVMCVCVLE